MSFTNHVRDSWGIGYWVRNDAIEAFYLIDELMGELDDQPEKLEYYRQQMDIMFERA